MSKFRNAFGARRVTGGELDKRTSAIGVHKSLFSYLQQIGYEGSPAAVSAWAMIKAVRPTMKDHRDALASLVELPRDRLQELRECAVKTSESAKTQASPARQELVGDVIAMLDGFLSRFLPAPPVSGVAGARAPVLTLAEEVGFASAEARMPRIVTRIEELVASGVARVDAEAQAMQEIP